MDKLDARKFSEETLQVLRRQADRLRREGRTWDEIAAIVGVNRSAVLNWHKRYGIGEAGVLGDVSSSKRGRMFGDSRTLDMAQETLLRDKIVQGSPMHLNLPYALWNRNAVKLAVKVMWGIDMPIRTVGEYLRRWGFTPQRPAKRALAQDPVAVQQWLQVQYPAIVRQAKAEHGLIHWGDETAVWQDAAWARGYAPAGHTPVQEHMAQRPRPAITMISALTNQGLLRFDFVEAGMNSDAFIEFMRGLVNDSKSKVFFIVDNLRAHRSRKVQQWVQEHKNEIELFFLPPYSPEINPDELINRGLKTELRTRPAADNAGMLKGIAYRFMRRLCDTPQRVARAFAAPQVAYASSNMDRFYV